MTSTAPPPDRDAFVAAYTAERQATQRVIDAARRLERTRSGFNTAHRRAEEALGEERVREAAGRLFDAEQEYRQAHEAYAAAEFDVTTARAALRRARGGQPEPRT